MDQWSARGGDCSAAQGQAEECATAPSCLNGQLLQCLVMDQWSLGVTSTLVVTVAQSLQNPLIKEYTLNHIRDPNI